MNRHRMGAKSWWFGLILSIGLTAACSVDHSERMEADFSAQPSDYRVQLDGVVRSPVEETILAELGGGEPRAGEVHVVEVQEGNAESTSLISLSGTRNELNGIQLDLARSLGDGRDLDDWGGNEHAHDSGWRFQHDKVLIDGFKVEQMSTVNAAGSPVETWLVGRPRSDLLVGVRTYDQELAQARDLVAEMLANGVSEEQS